MKLKQRVLEGPFGSNLDEVSEAESQHSEFKGEVEAKTPRRKWHPSSNSNVFRVEIPEFEGKLDLDEFLEWLHTVERIFEYKDVPEDKGEASCPQIEKLCISMVDQSLYQEN